MYTLKKLREDFVVEGIPVVPETETDLFLPDRVDFPTASEGEEKLVEFFLLSVYRDNKSINLPKSNPVGDNSNSGHQLK